MGKNSSLPNQIVDPILLDIYQSDTLSKWPSIIQEMKLADLIELKLQTVSKIKSLVGIVSQNNNLSFDKILELLEKIEAHQYNLTIFKQLNAIANAGSPSKNMFGINACIYRSSDLKTLNAILSKLQITYLNSTLKGVKEFKTSLNTKIQTRKQISTKLYKMQSDYNQHMKIKVEYLVIS